MDPGKRSHSKVLIENAMLLPIKEIPKEKQLVFKSKVIQLLYLNNYIRMWKHIFNRNWHTLGGKKLNSKYSLKKLSVDQSEEVWFDSFSLIAPITELEYPLPTSFDLDFEIITKNDMKRVIITIYNPEIGTMKLCEFETFTMEALDLTILGLTNYITQKRSQYPKTVRSLLERIILPVVNRGNIITETIMEYNIFIQSADSLEFCEVLNHSEHCNHKRYYSNHINPELKFIQNKSYFSDLLLLKKQIDAELEALVLKLYGINFNAIFDNFMISSLEKERVRSYYS
jgi:hypothetical protein